MPLARERRRRFRSQEPHLRVGHIDTTFWNHRPNRTNKIGFKTLTSVQVAKGVKNSVRGFPGVEGSLGDPQGLRGASGVY